MQINDVGSLAAASMLPRFLHARGALGSSRAPYGKSAFEALGWPQNGG